MLNKRLISVTAYIKGEHRDSFFRKGGGGARGIFLAFMHTKVAKYEKRGFTFRIKSSTKNESLHRPNSEDSERTKEPVAKEPVY